MAKIYLHGREGEYVSIEELVAWVRKHPLPDGRIIPILIWGMRGMGKSETVKSYCEENGLAIEIVHPTQLAETAGVVGIPFIENGKTSFALPKWLPPADAPPGILFLDEINRAPREVLNGLMQLIGEGQITQAGYVLPKGWMVMAAANPSEMRSEGDEAYTVTILDEALVDRFLHYNPGYSPAGWVAWAKKQPGMNRKLIDFVLRNPELIDSEELGGLPQEIESILGTSLRSATYCSYVLPEGVEAPERLVKVISYGLLGRTGSDRLLEMWDEEEYSITFEDVMDGQWEDRLMSWQGNKDRFDLIEASISHVVAGLVIHPPDPENPNSRRIALEIGRFGSLLEEDHLETFYKQMERSAKTWMIPIRRVVEKYSETRGDLF
jgi:hypothetical protein